MHQIDSILCPTDFFMSSVRATDLASFAITKYKGKITLRQVDESIETFHLFSKDPL